MDASQIGKLVALGEKSETILKVQDAAAKAMKNAGYGYTLHNACAATLSVFLNEAGIDVPVTLGAGKLAKRLRQDRKWTQITKGDQQAGDVGVTLDNTSPSGADHIYLVIEALDKDKMYIADNQAPKKHLRYVSGKGKTPTDYFLRATNVNLHNFRFRQLANEIIDPNDTDFFPWDDEDTNDLKEPFGDNTSPVADRSPSPSTDINVESIARQLVDLLIARQEK